MTRVLMIAPTPFFSDRGCHVRIYEQARHLIELGVDLEVLTYPIGYDPTGIKVTRVKNPARYSKAGPGPSWQRLLLDALVLAKAWRICGKKRPDLVHAHLHEGCLAGIALKKRFSIPLLFDYQGSLTMESLQHGFIRPEGAAARAFRAVERSIDKAADKVIVSAGVFAESLKASGVIAEPLTDGVDTERFSPGPPDNGLRRKLGLPEGAPVVVYLGVTSHYQGTDVALKAARILRDRSVDAHFLVMGYPEEKFRREAVSTGLDGMVTFTGRLDYFKAPSCLRLGRVAIAPKLSNTEANGKVVNYMACGLPVVAFDTPVNRELIGDNAQWVQPSEDRDICAAGMAEALGALLGDREKARELARAGRERAVTMFSMKDRAEKLLNMYESMLEAP